MTAILSSSREGFLILGYPRVAQRMQQAAFFSETWMRIGIDSPSRILYWSQMEKLVESDQLMINRDSKYMRNTLQERRILCIRITAITIARFFETPKYTFHAMRDDRIA